MPADAGFRRQLLRDTEATLRQVRGALLDLTEHEGPDVVSLVSRIEDSTESATELAELLVAMHAELRAMVDELRRERRRAEAGRAGGSGDTRDAQDVLGDLESRLERLFRRLTCTLDLGEADSDTDGDTAHENTLAASESR